MGREDPRQRGQEPPHRRRRRRLHRELLRDGQVFYIHNRVESIELVSEKIKSLVPGIKIGKN